MNFTRGILTLLFLTAIAIGCNTESEADKKSTSTKNSKATTNKTPNATKATQSTNQEGLIKWVSIEEAENLSKDDKKKIMVDLYTNWCGWCKRMDKATFQHPEIAQYVNDNFYAVKFNAEDKNTINFNGKQHNFVQAGRRGYNELAFQFANGRMSYPTISFLDENLNVINAFPGYKDPSKFDPLLRFISEDHYKTKTLAQFQSTYQSNIPPTQMNAQRGGGNKIPIQVKRK